MVAEPMSSSNPPLVVLKNGLTVPVDAVRLLWQLEDRGLYVRVTEMVLRLVPVNI